MTALTGCARALGLLLIWCALICAAPCAVALNPAAGKNRFSTITDSGKYIDSIFDGLSPNLYVRNALFLKTERPARLPIAISGDQDIGRMFRRMLVSAPAAYLSCPTGGVCAQPGTAGVPGGFCGSDPDCNPDLHNQANTTDFSQGTLESYYCVECCVDWTTCPIDLGGLGCNQGTGGDGGIDPLQTCGTSPVIVDFSGKGFFLTSAANGVKFDIQGNGAPIDLGWTAPGADNAFLALPGGDGLIHNGKELFGNFTPQPASATPNGFLALAVYDKPENGGNGDGIIDVHDSVFSRLRLWVDKNHDGICQKDELFTLPQLGVFSLSLNYLSSRRRDAFGNAFRYKARVNPGQNQNNVVDTGPWAYDVFLVHN
jgi:hypothetical protein